MGVLNKNTSYLAEFVTYCCIGPMWSPSIVLGVVHQPATEQVNQLLYMGTTHCKYHAINLSLNTSEIYFNLTTEYINQMHNILAYIHNLTSRVCEYIKHKKVLENQPNSVIICKIKC